MKRALSCRIVPVYIGPVALGSPGAAKLVLSIALTVSRAQRQPSLSLPYLSGRNGLWLARLRYGPRDTADERGCIAHRRGKTALPTSRLRGNYCLPEASLMPILGVEQRCRFLAASSASRSVRLVLEQGKAYQQSRDIATMHASTQL